MSTRQCVCDHTGACEVCWDEITDQHFAMLEAEADESWCPRCQHYTKLNGVCSMCGHGTQPADFGWD